MHPLSYARLQQNVCSSSAARKPSCPQYYAQTEQKITGMNYYTPSPGKSPNKGPLLAAAQSRWELARLTFSIAKLGHENPFRNSSQSVGNERELYKQRPWASIESPSPRGSRGRTSGGAVRLILKSAHGRPWAACATGSAQHRLYNHHLPTQFSGAPLSPSLADSNGSASAQTSGNSSMTFR